LIHREGGWPKGIEGKAFFSMFESGLFSVFHWLWTSNLTAPVDTSSPFAFMGASPEKAEQKYE
jgi:hypothetical protein